jgi:alpha-1,6-mannosyltransferase
VAVTSAQWLHTHALYGPAFTLMSSAIVRAWSRSPGGVILAFKVAAGAGIAIATACVALAARTVRPERAALAVVLVGLNPVVVVHTVGGGHVDALLAAPLGAALAMAVRVRPVASRRTHLSRAGVTLLLTLAVLIKTVVLPALALWLWSVARAARRGRRARVATLHVLLAAAVSAAFLAPFVDGRHTLTALASFGGVEAWASGVHLISRGAQAVFGSDGGRAASRVVAVGFLLAYVGLFWRLGRRAGRRGPVPADDWGVALLLLALALPYLLPWYVCWFVPFLGLVRDDALMKIGAAVTCVLALTLIPADPFRGYSTWGVMTAVHYVAAPIMLVLFVAAARRVLASTGDAPGYS